MAIPDRNLALELIRVTETAALAAAPWVGRGQKDLADKAAVEAMRKMINTVDMAGEQKLQPLLQRHGWDVDKKTWQIKQPLKQCEK